MSDPVEADRPVCNSSQSAKEQFAAARVAEHIKEKASRDESHQRWIDEHTERGTLAEIRAALAEHGRPRQ